MSHCFQFSFSQSTNPQGPFLSSEASSVDPLLSNSLFLEFKPFNPLLHTDAVSRVPLPRSPLNTVPILKALWKRAPTKRPAEKSLKILLFKLSETARIKRSCRHVSAKFNAVCLCHQSSLNNFSFRYFPVRPCAMRCSSHKCISIALVAPKVFHFGYIQHYASHLTWEAIVIKYIRLIFLRKGSQVEIQSRQTP